jgi:hypothetical protein
MELDLPPSPWHMPDTGNCFFPGSQIEKLTICSFAEAVLKGLNGETGIIEPSFVYLPGVPGGEEIAKQTGVDFFSVPIQLGVLLPSAS